MVLITRPINSRLEISRCSGVLLAYKDGEVVVCEVETGVAFGLQGGAEEDQVFGYGGVEDYH
jgi:hypothetical protein